ncbi:transposase [Natranaerobius trueperi]|uniref:transposase n=1 Tax=Natranaerobius trueperi TaxID=759412 RepID=UPI00197C38A6|nr:transposase [Natranaerobius trueperi]
MKDQISFFDYSDEFQKLDSHSKLKKLSHYIDFAEIIPQHVRDRYYNQTGRPPYSIESMLSALIIQKLVSIPTVELLVSFLELSRPLKNLCGFTDSVPNPSTFTRFKQKLSEEDYKEILHKLVELTEPYLRNVDPFDSTLLVLDTTGFEIPVKENNPKYFYSLKRKVEKGTPKRPEHELIAQNY